MRAILLALLLFPSVADAVRVKELAQVQGVRTNELVGYGIVVGLSGTGDTERVFFTQQSISGLLARLGIRVDPREVRVRNVAAVMVTARLPPFARPGTQIDVHVGSLGNARSLAGGLLLVTPLNGADGQVYALAQGPLQVGGFDASALGTSVSRNFSTSGRVPGGATIERAVDFKLAQGPLLLQLSRPDFTNATRIAAAVNGAFGEGAAKALDPAAVEVAVPEGKDPVTVIAQLELLDVDVDRAPRVVVSERTGVLVAGENVRLRPAAVAHGGLTVTINQTPLVSQPNAFSRGGNTVVAPVADVNAREDGSSVVALPATASVEDLAKALNTLGATPRDLVEILQALKKAGALEAELEVL